MCSKQICNIFQPLRTRSRCIGHCLSIPYIATPTCNRHTNRNLPPTPAIHLPKTRNGPPHTHLQSAQRTVTNRLHPQSIRLKHATDRHTSLVVPCRWMVGLFRPVSAPSLKGHRPRVTTNYSGHPCCRSRRRRRRCRPPERLGVSLNAGTSVTPRAMPVCVPVSAAPSKSEERADK